VEELPFKGRVKRMKFEGASALCIAVLLEEIGKGTSSAHANAERRRGPGLLILRGL
jgi:hypothetical protein